MRDMLEEFKLDGKVAIVTSANGSWVQDIALSLKGAGARVLAAVDSREKTSTLISELQPKVDLSLSVNLSDAQEVENLVARTISQFGKVDILVNNLNREFWKPILEISEKEWLEVIQSNLTSAFLCSKAVGKHLVVQKSGSIINIISGLAERGVPNGTAYCASLGGILELTRALALEWAPKNIRVNAVGIGWKDRPIAQNEKDIMARYIPLQHRTRPRDVLPLITFLASDASSYMSGSFYIADGGLMARA
jgi:NAD(P)-dependent dehydrogenase (short-subunit alcohol dehydrogenase family)